MKIKEMINISGRGDVIVGEYESGDKLWNIGDNIWWNENVYTIRGIEQFTKLTDPPRYSKEFGLQVINQNKRI